MIRIQKSSTLEDSFFSVRNLGDEEKTVEGILCDVRMRKDEAIREL